MTGDAGLPVEARNRVLGHYRRLRFSGFWCQAFQCLSIFCSIAMIMSRAPQQCLFHSVQLPDLGRLAQLRTPEGRVRRGVMASQDSLCDDDVQLSSAEALERGILPLEFEELNHFAEFGAVLDMHQVLRRIKQEVPCNMKRILYNTAIKACARAKQISVAELYYKVMLSEGIRPSKRTFGKLIHCCANAGRLDLAEKWLSALRSEGFQLDVMSCSLMAKAAARSCDMVAADKWLMQIVNAGKDPLPSVVGEVISAASRSGDVAMAERWFEFALDQKPFDFSYDYAEIGDGPP